MVAAAAAAHGSAAAAVTNATAAAAAGIARTARPRALVTKSSETRTIPSVRFSSFWVSPSPFISSTRVLSPRRRTTSIPSPRHPTKSINGTLRIHPHPRGMVLRRTGPEFILTCVTTGIRGAKAPPLRRRRPVGTLEMTPDRGDLTSMDSIVLPPRVEITEAGPTRPPKNVNNNNNSSRTSRIIKGFHGAPC